MKIDCIWWDRYTPCSTELFGPQMSLLLLDQASSRFRLKHEQPILEYPEVRLDHLRLESDLSDPLVCLVEEPVGSGTSQGQSPILKLLGKSSHL